MTATNRIPEGSTYLGAVQIEARTYMVFRLPAAGPASTAAGLTNYAFKGAKGAMFMVTDHGPKYNLVSVSMTRGFYPIRGLRREHLDRVLAAAAEVEATLAAAAARVTA